MAAGGNGQDPNGGDGRLSSLDARLKAASDKEAARSGAVPRGPGKGYTQGSRVLTELIAGPAGGALVGWLLDRWLGTAPWALLALLILGIAVAFRNIIAISRQRPD